MLAVGELQSGARDVFLGSVHGVDVFEQRGQPDRHFRSGWDILLDLAPGMPTGFSLRPGKSAFRSARLEGARSAP